jgi:hypothetical protein
MAKKTQITEALIDDALKHTSWDLGNKALYDLCQQYPAHNKEDEIIAKIWLIGRTYAAAIERRKIHLDITSDEFQERVVVEKMKSAPIDQWLSDVSFTMTDPWQDLGKAVKVHRQLTDLFSDVTGLEKRSLASKYLHFHKPEIFFIYDSRAKNALAKVTPSIKEIKKIEAEIADDEYLALVRRCQWLRDDIKKQFGKTLNPRELDKVLLWFG